MAKFKVGDKVRVINFKENPPHWSKSGEMDKWKGKIVTLDKINRTNVTSDMEFSIVGDSGFYGQKWVWKSSDFEPINSREFIVIRRSGAETIAELRHDREVIKSAKATCAPSDTFDLDTGAKLAFDRLMGREEPKTAPQPAHRFKVGDRVQTEECGIGEVVAYHKNNNSNNEYCVSVEKNGMHSGRSFADRSVSAKHEGKCRWFSNEDLSPAPEPPKFYTGKVVCVGVKDQFSGYELGMVVEIKNGIVVNPKNFVVDGRYIPYVDFEHFSSKRNHGLWVEEKR